MHCYISFSSNCRQNVPLYKAAPFDLAFNVTKKLDIEEVRLQIIVGPKVNSSLQIFYNNAVWYYVDWHASKTLDKINNFFNAVIQYFLF